MYYKNSEILNSEIAIEMFQILYPTHSADYNDVKQPDINWKHVYEEKS